ncbi:MAG: 4a-hydroxytetrahydrobiopterin dehydratase [Dehalococcoidia bacterium]|nr:4a-hydroxytetrahydrobiopterin dehydratase [Dehalococcoidia bacterium]
MHALTIEQINEGLEQLSDWVYEDNNIVKKIETIDFIQAIGVIVRIALEAEKMNHHPTIENTYNKIIIRLSTHDASGITEKDFALAKKIDNLVSE